MAVERFPNAVREQTKVDYCIRTANILSSEYQKLPAAAPLLVPNMDTVKRDIQRQKAQNPPLEPATVQAINIQPPWDRTGGTTPLPFVI